MSSLRALGLGCGSAARSILPFALGGNAVIIVNAAGIMKRGSRAATKPSTPGFDLFSAPRNHIGQQPLVPTAGRRRSPLRRSLGIFRRTATSRFDAVARNSLIIEAA
jgi:hypothetical protein